MIPKKIHYFWFGNGEKPDLVKKCIASWIKYCPDYEIIEWNETNYDVTKNAYMYQAYQAKRWGFVSDYARLDVIFEYGGIYLDTDVELIRSLDDLLNTEGYIGFETIPSKGSKRCINSGQGFGAAKNNRIIAEMRDLYNDLKFINEDGSNNLTPCPTYNTQIFLNHGIRLDDTKQSADGFIVYPSEFFCPMSWNAKKLRLTDHTYSIHHFTESWLSPKEKRRRRISTIVHRIVHIPNVIAVKLLGKEAYSRLKVKLKG